MSEEILINITPMESRVAVVENGVLQEVHVERTQKRGIVGNIYKGKVVRVLPGMQAAFVDIGLDRAAFIHASEISLREGPAVESISALVHEGQSLVVQVTKDHSFLQEQLDAGLLTPEQAAQSPNKNLVTRALGVEEQVMLELHEHQVEEGDLYLMCSDGLSDMISDATIASVLLNDLSLTQKADKLVFLANQEGGRDNISVLLVQATRPTEKRGLISRWLGKH